MKEENYKVAIETVIFNTFCNAFNEGCSRCTLSEHGCHPVTHRGNEKAPILLIGEGPGLIEEQERKPFVGPAGQLLDKIMLAIGLDTNKDMILMNCVMCRPTAQKGSGKQNYTPKKEQLVRCWPFIENAIFCLKPKIIIGCGGTAIKQLLNDDTVKVSEWEGKWNRYKKFEDKPYKLDIPIFCMTHPSSILHKAKWPEKQLEAKKKVWKYMQEFRDTWKDK